MRKQLSIAVLFPVDVRAMISNLNTPPAAALIFTLPDRSGQTLDA